MNTSHTELIPAGFAANSRVWVYQGHRLFTMAEALETEHLLETFVQSWQSHGTPVKAYGNLFYGQFIVLMADTGISGCSTDSSVHLIQQIEQHTGMRLFDRLNLAFYIDGKVQLVPLAQLPDALENGFIKPETLYFNNTVQTKQELEEKWLMPLKDSWLSSRYLTAIAKG